MPFSSSSSSSSSSSNHHVKYDVFLSFRGTDTRNNFTSHLYSALIRCGIITFIDTRLERGEGIESAILKAIEESIISVVILSKNYASSPWCLDELVKIFECRDKQGQKIIPVFYHVDPTELDNQTGSFGEALAKHEQDFNEIIMDKVPNWRIVLSRAANIAREVMTPSRVESELIEVVLKEILKHLTYDISYGFKNLILIVLDNIDDYEQIELLAEEHTWFGEGNRIIITSRDKSVFQDRVDGIYEVEALTEHEALHLFRLFAFRESHSKRDHMELSKEVTQKEWRSKVKKLGRIPDKKIQNILKTSYDELDSHDQQIFLDIACFFKGEPIYCVVRFLDACGFSTLIGLKVLADKSLVIMLNEKVDMHDLLQEMGRQIIRQESKEPGIRSRLWNREDIYHVLKKNTGSGAIKGLCLDKSKLEKISLPTRVFANMNGIKLFKFHNFDSNVDTVRYFKDVEPVPENMVFPEGLEHLPNELRFLQWHFYPEKSLPSSFQPEKLLEINLSVAVLKDFGKECRELTEMPNFSSAPDLRMIDCVGCISLVEVSPSIGCLNKLHTLILAYCSRITSVPSIKSVVLLNLAYCPINKFPQLPLTIRVLNLSGTELGEVPSIGFHSRPLILNLRGCIKLKILPDSFFGLRDLMSLDCAPCLNISQLESNISLITSLRFLCLVGTDLESLPSAIQQLSILEELNLCFSRRLRSLPKLPPHLHRLDVSHCTSLQLDSTSLIGIQGYWGKLFFCDCTSLNHKEIRSILMHAHKRVLLLAHAPGKLYKEFNTSSKNHSVEWKRKFVVIIPGNIIPKWISDQSSGYSVTIPLPPNWFHNFLGFAVGIVFEFGKCTYDAMGFYWMRLESQFKSNCDHTSYSISANFNHLTQTTGSHLQGKQVLIWHSKDFFFTDKDQIVMDNMCHYNECGVRLLYINDAINPENDGNFFMEKSCFEDYCNYVEDDEPSSSYSFIPPEQAEAKSFL
ncbi:hypothetical protein RCOM_1077370 [Ricinus communis]|uniref:TIR domain-containing protein n=1 Tax=Ricinus communis TaxID=3988 RepID=B9RM27_RICCO|nr:hypothetical protein RCOM_1077370 [Ricinus communis]